MDKLSGAIVCSGVTQSSVTCTSAEGPCACKPCEDKTCFPLALVRLRTNCGILRSAQQSSYDSDAANMIRLGTPTQSRKTRKPPLGPLSQSQKLKPNAKALMQMKNDPRTVSRSSPARATKSQEMRKGAEKLLAYSSSLGGCRRSQQLQLLGAHPRSPGSSQLPRLPGSWGKLPQSYYGLLRPPDGRSYCCLCLACVPWRFAGDGAGDGSGPPLPRALGARSRALCSLLTVLSKCIRTSLHRAGERVDTVSAFEDSSYA